MTHGKFFVIEGGEGAGKTTIVSRLKKELSSDQYVFIREPGGTPLGNEVRKLLLDSTIEISPDSELALFMASRFQVFELIIRPAILAGKHVVADRMDASTFAYQVRARNQPGLEEIFWKMRERYLSLPGGGSIEPYYIFLELDPEVGLQRISDSGREVNRLDQESMSFHHLVNLGYEEIIPRMPRHLILSASGLPEQVYDDVFGAISRLSKEAVSSV